MPFCTNCGKEIGVDSKFCPNCGKENFSFNQSHANPINNADDSSLFSMKIADYMFMSQKGTAIVGEVLQGTIHTNEKIIINGEIYQVHSIEANRKSIESASQGMTVGLLISKNKIKIPKGTIAKKQ